MRRGRGGSGRGRRRGWSRDARHGRRDRHARGKAGRANDRVRRNGEIPPVDGHSAPGRRIHHADRREAGPASGGRRGADGNRLARAAGTARRPRIGPRAARDRRHLRATGSGARGQAAHGGRREPDGRRPRSERAEGRRSAAAHGAGTDPHGAHRSRLLPRHRSDRRHRRRHSRSRRRSRDEGDEADVDRCERRARGVPERARAAGREASRRPAGAHCRRHGRDDRRREDQLRLAVGRRADADGAREDAGLGAGHAAHRSVRAHVRDLDDRARTDGAGDGGDAHQRPVVRVRRRARRRRQRPGRTTAIARARTGRRQQLHRRQRVEARREIDRRRDSENPRRRACAGRRRETERRKGREAFSTHRSRSPSRPLFGRAA